MTLVIHAFGDTNKGLFREGNEDNLMVGKTVFAVADGMGGHAAGEVASEAALEPLRIIDGTTYDDPDEASEALARAVRQANEVVIDKATANPELRGMGTTLTTVMVRDQRLHLAHVGDSRAYLLRGGILELLTEDHTLVNQLVKEGRLTEEQAASHPQRSVITRAIGVEHGVEVDVLPPLDLMPDDQVLLCSDGLTGPVSESLIAEILKTEADGTIACQRLIDAANAGGGPDNITTVLLRVEGDGTTPMPAAAPARRTSDEDATAELADPATLDARRLVELSDGNRDIDDTPPQLRGRRGRRAGAVVLGVVLIAAVVIAGGLLLLNRQFYVGVDSQDQVGIYRGIQGQVLGVSLATLVQAQSFELDDLPERLHQGLEDGIAFGTLAEAETHVRTVLLPATMEAREDDEDPAEDPSPSPSPTPTETKTEPDVQPQPSPTSSP